jgi:hypothetical protein
LQAHSQGDYPAEFDMFLDKQTLFKVEVSIGNMNYKWRNYAVKKATAEDYIIEQFISKHNLKVYQRAPIFVRLHSRISFLICFNVFSYADRFQVNLMFLVVSMI